MACASFWKLWTVRTASVLGLAMALAGCQSASKAAHETAKAVNLGYGASMDAAAAIVDLLPGDEPASAQNALEQMRKQAGPARFRNERFTDAQARLNPTRPSFDVMRTAMKSPAFEQSRDAMRNGGVPSFQGSLAKSVGQPGQFPSALDVTQRVVHPVLGRVLPGFGVLPKK